MHFDSMESMKVADLQVSLPVPASLAVVRLKPLNGFAFISVEPALLLNPVGWVFWAAPGRPNTDCAAASAPAAQRFQSLMLRSFAADVTRGLDTGIAAGTRIGEAGNQPAPAAIGATRRSR